MIKHLLLDGDILTYRVAALGLHLDLSKRILDSTILSISEYLKCNEGTFFLSGSNQYRRQMSATSKGPDYKGNRTYEPPRIRDDLNRYLVTDYDGILLEGIEADDGMGILQSYAMDNLGSNDTCIVTIDKDLDQIPGWHYNYVKKSLYWVTPAQAERFLKTQMITGDVADNVFGIKGMGIKKANKYIDTGASVKDLYTCPMTYERNLILLTILRTYPPPEYLGKVSYQNLKSTLDSCISSLTKSLEGST